MRLVAIILLCLSCISSWAQDNRFRLEFAVTPSFTYRNLVLNEDYPTTQSIFKFRTENEAAMIVLNPSILINYSIGGQSSIKTGIRYLQRGQKTKFEALSFENQINPSNGFSNPTQEVSSSISRVKHHINYLQIPLLYQRSIEFKSITMTCQAGIGFDYLISTSMITIGRDSIGNKERRKYSDSYGYNKWNINAELGIGITIPLNEKLHLNLAPNFRYGLRQLIEAPITAYLWDAGVNLGLSIPIP